VKPYRIEIFPTARKELESLPKAARVRIGRKIDSLAENPEPPGVKLLKRKGRDVYRVRVGDYRVLYQIHQEILCVLVIRIGHRKDVYRGMSE
jgi:mRNA interferase RelE/StbE